MKAKLLLSTFVVAHIAYSANIFWNGGSSGNYNSTGNWSTEAVPGVGDAAFFRTGGFLDNIYQNAQVRSLDRFAIGINGDVSSVWSLNIGQFGGSISTVGSVQNNIGQQELGEVSVNIFGGGFSATNLTVIGAGAGGTATVHVSNGSLDLAAVDIGKGSNLGKLKVTGDSITSLTGGAFTFGANGSLDFNFSATGVKALDLNGLTANTGTLNVDLTNYTGGNGTVTLVDVSGTGQGIVSQFTNVNVTAGDYAGSFVTQDTNTNLVTLSIVPEASTFALLGGFLALSYVMFRRRRA